MSGMVSVTFRKLTAEEVVHLTKQAGLEGIEWGGDLHVPHGNLTAARVAARLTGDAGLKVFAYGSYYRAAKAGTANPSWNAVLDSALTLGSPLIRVWAGDTGSAEATADHWKAVADDLRYLGETAAQHRVQVGLEYHSRTLTDTPEATRRLLDMVGHPNVGSYWQYNRTGKSPAETAESIRQLGKQLRHIHVNCWSVQGQRQGLTSGATAWREFLKAARFVPGDRAALLEFVRGDDPAQFLLDAVVLRRLIAEANHAA